MRVHAALRLLRHDLHGLASPAAHGDDVAAQIAWNRENALAIIAGVAALAACGGEQVVGKGELTGQEPAPTASQPSLKPARSPAACATSHGRLILRPWYTVPDMDWKIELVAIPVSDVDRAKAFYVDQVGFHADHDHQVNDALRFVQLTPPGSACSIVLGTGITQMPPGSQKGVQCVVADVEAARRQLIAHGVPASDVDVQPWGSFVTFSDPDGNTWALQQLPSWR
jgi:catechol 2,3-dioxygenase-like lactoylglutathione lyase family enzyme